MGHGDEIVIADANFPAHSHAERLVRLESASATRAAEAILSVLPLDEYVEVPAAFLQLKPGQSTTEAEIIDFCRGTIATFRVPRYVRFVDEWPMSGTKIKKFELRQRIASELVESGRSSAAANIRSN